MKSIESGRLRHLITIQQRAVSQDEIGGQLEAWSTRCTVWAEKTPQAGREFVAAGNLNAVRPEIFRIRFRTDISTDDRIIADGQVYAVRSVANLGGMSAVLELITEAGAEQR